MTTFLSPGSVTDFAHVHFGAPRQSGSRVRREQHQRWTKIRPEHRAFREPFPPFSPITRQPCLLVGKDAIAFLHPRPSSPKDCRFNRIFKKQARNVARHAAKAERRRVGRAHAARRRRAREALTMPDGVRILSGL